ncbi:MAG: hypothetical protein J1E28_02270 [Helicobacter sp.]|uniref:hypothetical protein n=1 Tax=Helicobacter sp. TaxID=218 RepID=UPI0025C11B8C|nr:hypothetical protein [Helicobacter sp.]MCH5313212.1 hypothetical protein [Helicobacter sp.]
MGAGLRNWLIPTLSFIGLLYILLLLGIWAYRVDTNVPFFTNDGPKDAATLKSFAKEMKKYVE